MTTADAWRADVEATVERMRAMRPAERWGELTKLLQRMPRPVPTPMSEEDVARRRKRLLRWRAK